MKSTYELIRWKSPKSPDFVKALKLYSDNIEPAYRTDTNEITYWLERFEKKFGDPFYILGLYYNSLLIGFSELAFFREEKFIQIDYLVIDQKFRKNNSFYEFLDKISSFLSQENLIYDYIICEVGCYFEGNEPTENSKALIRLLKMSHFGVLKSAYYAPRLGKNNYESQTRAVLMMYSAVEVKQIKTETYLKIIQTIYFKYYERWYFDFFLEKERTEYKTLLNNLFEKIKKSIGNKDYIEINGYNNLLPLNPTDFAEIKGRKMIKVLSFAIIFIVSIFVFGSLVLLIKKYFDIDIENQTAILTIAIIAASGITSFIFGNRSNLSRKILDKLIDML